MVRTLEVLVEEPRVCSYLEDETASLEHEILLDVTPGELETRLARGWRRFGPDYFRPRCPACSACVSTRIVAPEFAPTKSQRRARRQCGDLRIEVGIPRVDDERLALYHAWHASREDARGWSASRLDRRSYFAQFAFPHPAAREVAYFDDAKGGRLVGIGLSDETPHAWSAIYFFYDPAYASRSIGIANVVAQVEIAKALGIPHVYLGFRITRCASMRYKASFHPQEVLIGSPSPDEEPRWVRAPKESD
jgi:arginyl-tRNA--protein-N-Asp/Glu arginylyltransferase